MCCEPCFRISWRRGLKELVPWRRWDFSWVTKHEYAQIKGGWERACQCREKRQILWIRAQREKMSTGGSHRRCWSHWNRCKHHLPTEMQLASWEGQSSVKEKCSQHYQSFVYLWPQLEKHSQQRQLYTSHRHPLRHWAPAIFTHLFCFSMTLKNIQSL